MSEVCVCSHCGTELSGSGKYCQYCNTAAGRKLMDEENKKHFSEHGLVYHCKFCEKNKVEEIIKS